MRIIMTDSERAIIKTALKAYEDRENLLISRSPYTALKHSATYDEKISEIKKSINQPQSTHVKQKFALLIAAVILMCALITACVFGKQIAGFLYEIFDTHTELEYVDENAPKVIETTMQPTFIPEGYELREQKILTKIVMTLWNNGDDIISLQQETLQSAFITIDTDNENLSERFVGQYKTAYRVSNGIILVVWKTEEYAFTLTCPESLSWEEIEALIVGIE